MVVKKYEKDVIGVSHDRENIGDSEIGRQNSHERAQNDFPIISSSSNEMAKDASKPESNVRNVVKGRHNRLFLS